MGGWNSTMPGFKAEESSVPSSAGGMGPDVSELIKNLTTPIDPNLVRAAYSPIAGAHATQVPSNLTTPIAPHQDTPFMTGRVYGKSYAKARGVGNAIIGATNALGAIVTKEAQVRQNNIRDAAQKVITAQQAIDEAKTAHDQAIAAGDAASASKYQEMIQKNQQARDAVFADPKMRKALQKGFDISYTDPESNKTEEHAAVQEAMKNAKTFQEKREAMQKFREQQNQKAGAAMGAAYEKAQPQGFAPNVLAQQQLSTQLATQKLQQQALKDIMTFKASVYRSDKMYDASQMRTVASAIMQQARFAQQDLQLHQRFAQADKLLGERFAQENKLVYLRAQVSRQLQNEVFTDKEFDPLNMKTKSEKVASSFNSNYLADLAQIQKLIAARDKMFPDGADSSKAKNDPNYEAYNTQIRNLEAMRDLDQQKAQFYNNLSDNISKAFNVTGVGSDGTGSFGSSEQQSDAVGGDFTDPLNWLSDEQSSSNEE